MKDEEFLEKRNSLFKCKNTLQTNEFFFISLNILSKNEFFLRFSEHIIARLAARLTNGLMGAKQLV